nr:kexin [Quercus suber]
MLLERDPKEGILGLSSPQSCVSRVLRKRYKARGDVHMQRLHGNEDSSNGAFRGRGYFYHRVNGAVSMKCAHDGKINQVSTPDQIRVGAAGREGGWGRCVAPPAEANGDSCHIACRVHRSAVGMGNGEMSAQTGTRPESAAYQASIMLMTCMYIAVLVRSRTTIPLAFPISTVLSTPPDMIAFARPGFVDAVEPESYGRLVLTFRVTGRYDDRRLPEPATSYSTYQTMRLSSWSSTLVLLLIPFACASPRPRDYDAHDYYAVHLRSTVDPLAVAAHLKLDYDGPLGELEDHHIFRAPQRQHEHDHIRGAIEDLKHGRRRRDPGLEAPHVLDDILLSQKQELHKRFPLEKRSIIPPRQELDDDAAVAKGLEIAQQLEIGDPIFQDQWHLFNHVQVGHDINVTGVWAQGITGKNSTVCIVDDGLDMDSDDLRDNYFAAGSYDFNEQAKDPKPRLSDDRHGTRCAGEVAAVRNNVCGVGVMYDGKVSGARILSKAISDADEAVAMNYAFQENQIYSCSWGPPDDGQSMEKPGVLIERAMVTGVQKGRGGKGSIYVFAIGNGAANDDNCNFDGYTNSIYSVSVGSIDRKGLHPYYSEKCSAQLVVTYSSGSGDAIHTTDVGKDKCYDGHGGTSAAGPLVAGIYGLMLEANPDLTWRDVQWITVLTAVKVDQIDEWQPNDAVGKEYSHQYGYGKADAYAMVEMAKAWESVNPQAWYFSPWLHVKHDIPQGDMGLASSFDVTEDMLLEANLARLEHVTVTMNVQHTRRGDLSVELRSPTGMVSHLATHRRNDAANSGYVDWSFMSVAHWGESGVGTWTVVVKDTNVDDQNGTFTDWRLRLYGESIDGAKQELLPLPTPHDDDDHDTIHNATVSTASVSVPSVTGSPEGNPDDHIDRPTKPTFSAESSTSLTTPSSSIPTATQSSSDSSTSISKPGKTTSSASTLSAESSPVIELTSSIASVSMSVPTSATGTTSAAATIPATPEAGDKQDEIKTPVPGSAEDDVTSPTSTNASNFLPHPFPTFGVSKNTQIWIYGALTLILVFLVALGTWSYYMRNKKRKWMSRDDYGFEMVDNDDHDAMMASGGPMKGKRRAGELYDAFAEGSDEREPFDLGSDSEDERERTDAPAQSGSAQRYRDDEPLKRKAARLASSLIMRSVLSLPLPHRLTRRFPQLRRITVIQILLLLIWLYTLHWGERSTFAAHIKACEWETWEQWPADARPHHMVLIADPQLVDPHTYPGRPWPLSALTEKYTDLYMARNFRLINHELDPDSVVFLGDLFDGGREWEPAKAKDLKPWQIEMLKNSRPARDDSGTPSGAVPREKGDGQEADVEVVKSKRSLDDGSSAGAQDDGHTTEHKKTDKNKDAVAKDPKAFVPGEQGRWQKWGQKQWDEEYRRFVRIFFEERQLYPTRDRQLVADYLGVTPDAVSVSNGASKKVSFQAATAGGKQRRLVTSLPGNHDLGFGEKVQLSVRNRFYSRFGEGNRVDVLGNHTLVSIDTPSLSAQKQYVTFGETSDEKALQLRHIWEPTAEFLNNLTSTVATTNIAALRELYPNSDEVPRLMHDVMPLENALQHATKRDPTIPGPQLPIILLTHVPLYRDSDTDCGRRRERGNAIPLVAGYQYQNVITKDLTHTLIGRISSAGSIAHVFSGDDHDYCELNHRYNVDVAGSRSTVLRNVKEITVKSFSWAMGVRRPGFQLVSLWNPVGPDGQTVGTPLPTIQSHLCLLPDQLRIFIEYALLLGVTLVNLVVRAIWVGLRAEESSVSESDDDFFPFPRLSLPRFSNPPKATANGFSTIARNGSQSKGRQRASSTSASTNGSNANNLSVQRSYTARTRSISPNPYAGQLPGPLIDQAGYYPQVRWTDPDEFSDDEESNLGTVDEDDTQAKWRRQPRKKGKVRRVLDELSSSLFFIGGVSVVYYTWLISHDGELVKIHQPHLSLAEGERATCEPDVPPASSSLISAAPSDSPHGSTRHHPQSPAHAMSTITFYRQVNEFGSVDLGQSLQTAMVSHHVGFQIAVLGRSAPRANCDIDWDMLRKPVSTTSAEEIFRLLCWYSTASGHRQKDLILRRGGSDHREKERGSQNLQRIDQVVVHY